MSIEAQDIFYGIALFCFLVEALRFNERSLIAAGLAAGVLYFF